MTHRRKEINKVPNLRFPEFSGEWKECEIGNILKIGSGKDYKHLSKGDIPVFGTGGYMTSVNDYLFDGETVCIGRKGTINKPFYFNGRLWTVDTLFYSHSFWNVIPKFVFYVFEQVNWLKYNEASGVPSLSKKTIEQIKVTIPEINEQKRISNLLSLIDEKIQTQNQIITELESLIKGFREKLFKQEIRLKDEMGNNFPKWSQKKLGAISKKKSSNISANKIENNYGKYVLYGASGVLKNVDFYEEENNYISIVKDGAGVGRLFYCESKSSVLGTMDIIKPQPNINTYFLFCLLNTINFIKYVTGSTIPHIYFKDYKNETCFVPCIEEQNKIASFHLLLDEKLQVEKTILKRLKEQRQYLFQQLFI